MTGIMPLLLMWLWSRREGGEHGAPPSVPKPPQWPTPASPPPMPAFSAQQGVPTAETATPLSTLHDAALAPPAPEDHPRPKPPPARTTPAQAARAAVTHAATSTAKHAAHAATSHATRAVSTALHPASKPKLAPSSAHPVSDIEKVLMQHGIGISPPMGYYGPKTAAAWHKLAASKKLVPTISRVGPKVAMVVTHTYDVLSVPPIP